MLALALLSAALPAVSQQVPDAGTLLREQPRPPTAPAVPAPSPAAAPPAAAPAPGGARILVRGVRVTGSTLIPEAELAARLQDLVGKEVTFPELQAAAGKLTGHYAERGWIARVLVPPQEVREGIVTFRAIEGIRGGVTVESQDRRIDTARVGRFIDQRLPAGALMSVDALSGALAILNGQPGADVSAAMGPGANEREISLRLSAADTRPVRLSAGLNNEGTRATGVAQAGARVALVNPTGRFDELSVLLNVSEGLAYVRGAYSLAIGETGLRVGGYASGLRYRLVAPAFSALQARGSAGTLGLSATLPLARRTAYGFNLVGSAEARELQDRTAAGETGNRRVKLATLGVEGYAILPDSDLALGVAFTHGDSDQRNAAALAADLAGRNTQGAFTKLAWNGAFQHALGSRSVAGVRVRGQWADRNLESSERMALGGPSGVRAYPIGEAAGDEGWFATFSVATPLGAAWRLGAFYDVGRIQVNRNGPLAGATTPNRYVLAGAGVSLDWTPTANSSLGIAIAAPVGSNPGRDAQGRNVDGSRQGRPRAWLTAAAHF